MPAQSKQHNKDALNDLSANKISRMGVRELKAAITTLAESSRENAAAIKHLVMLFSKRFVSNAALALAHTSAQCQDLVL